jgi:hypothetical protein
VLLRWVATEAGPSSYGTFLLKRRADAEAAFTDLAVVARLDDPAAIEAVFPGGSEIRGELTGLIVPDLGPTLAAALLALRGAADPAGRMQYEMLLNTNYGVAIAEGVAYLDAAVVAGTRYAYELWGIDPASGTAVERLGKVWVKAGEDTMLPAPLALDAVRVADVDRPPLGNFPQVADGDIDLDGDGKLDGGEFGDGKIYLRWEPSADPGARDRETRPTGFGFDIYRAEKGGLAVCPPDPLAGAVKVNEQPVIPISATPDTDDMPDFFFVDDNSNDAIRPLVKGATYCYWLVARNLLRQGGRPSDPEEACVPDLGFPRQVRNVTAQVSVPSSDGIKISWTPNASDPVTLDGGNRYIDDTAGYNVYRFTDFQALLRPPGDFLPCAAAGPLTPCVLCNVGAALTSCTDPGPADEINRGKIYWYAVTAVDAAMCGNPSNESPYSAPARGVVYDETPPSIGMVVPFCDRAPSSTELPCIRDCCLGTQCPPDPSDDRWCDAGGAPGIYPRPGDTWGYKVPPPMPADTMSVRLYRGSKGSDFRPVEEAFFSPPDNAWVLVEEFRTRSSQKIEYRLRALDRDSNIGPLPPAPIPAYLQGTAPPPPPTIVRATLDPDLGTAVIRWHAPGAEALAGFMLRVGPKDRPRTGTFSYLPAVNDLASEITLGSDVDGDFVPEPDVIVVRRTTRCLADQGADLGGLRAPDGYLEQTVPVPEGAVVEIYAIDITGQLSAPAVATPTPLALLALDTIPWPKRSAPPAFALGAVFTDAAADYVELCWDRQQPVPGGGPGVHPDHVAVFRTVVEAGRPDSYQQRSPRVGIGIYNAGGLLPGGAVVPALVCSDACKDDLAIKLGGPPSGSVVCWQDFGIAPGTTYHYTVLGFGDPPPVPDPEGPPVDRDPRKRNEGEIESVYGSPDDLPGAAEVMVP